MSYVCMYVCLLPASFSPCGKASLQVGRIRIEVYRAPPLARSALAAAASSSPALPYEVSTAAEGFFELCGPRGFMSSS